MASTISPTPSSASIPGARRTSDASRSAAALRVTTAVESAARDHAAISAGTPSFALMLHAGTRAAEVILRDYSEFLSGGVAVYAGSGNNGGDAYIVGAQLARLGVRVSLHVVAEPKTDDAQRAAVLARSSQMGSSASSLLNFSEPSGRERVVVDGILGTGHRGVLRDAVLQGARDIQAARASGAVVVALDIPTGVNPTTGEVSPDAVVADVTVAFGTIKRGELIARGHVGRLVLADIGLGEHTRADDDAWHLHSAQDLASLLPSIAWNAHKRSRGYLSVVGGAEGMAGAVVLATRAALASGAGLTAAVVDGASTMVLQQSIPQAITRRWDAVADVAPEWPDAMVIGPGLGRTAASFAVLQNALAQHPAAPLVLDADALTLLATPSFDTQRFRDLCGQTRAVVCTPHLGEFARLTGVPANSDWDTRSDVLRDFARRIYAVVVLKGTPTLVASPDGRLIFAAPCGSAVLATGGSGDMLAGIIGAFLAQGMQAIDAACLAVAVHGQAAELVATEIGVRGSALDDVMGALPSVWSALKNVETLPPGVLMELPNSRVGL